jgi:hypothetical protein
MFSFSQTAPCEPAATIPPGSTEPHHGLHRIRWSSLRPCLCLHLVRVVNLNLPLFTTFTTQHAPSLLIRSSSHHFQVLGEPWLFCWYLPLMMFFLAFLMAMRLGFPFGSNSPVLTEKIFCRIEKRRTFCADCLISALVLAKSDRRPSPRNFWHWRASITLVTIELNR